jgi:Zn-dependent alcohol dehydrogenase
MNISAAVLYAINEPFRIESLQLDAPRAGEVLVRMSAVGVCRSDLHLLTGDTDHPLPVVAGHEGAGIVESIGEGVHNVSVGDHVTLNWAPACRDCFYCNGGRPNLCETFLEPIWKGTLLDGTPRLSLDGQPVYHYCGLGAFADHVVVPQQSCVRMDSEIPMTVCALIGCAVATGVGAVLNTAEISTGGTIAVFGAGGVGLSAIMAARMREAAAIIAVDPSPQRRELALQFGATDAIPADEASIGRIQELTGGRGADYVFEAVGNPRVQEQCLAAARPGGVVVLAGLSPMGSHTDLPGAVLTRQEKTVIGSYYGTTDPARDFPQYGEYFKQGRLPLDRMISKTYSLEQINEAFEDLVRADAGRGLIVFA